jgi:hypothetical protein
MPSIRHKPGLPLSVKFFAGVLVAVSCTAASAPKKITVACDRDLDIKADAAKRVDWGGESVWLASAQNDTLVLSRKGSCGDECHYEERIVLASLGTRCPTLVSATITKTDAGSVAPVPRVRTATDGTLEIQDWHPAGGIVSGRLKAEFTLTFYAQTPASSPQK